MTIAANKSAKLAIDRETILFVALFAILLALAIAVRLRGGEVTQRSPDENTYMSYATTAAAQPFDGPRQIVESYNEIPKDWFYPSPLRFVYYEGIAGLMNAFHESVEAAGVQFTLFFSLLQWVCVAMLGFRFFDRWVVLAALAFLTFSPPDLVASHRVWGDGPVGGMGMCVLWLAVESALRPRNQWWFAAMLFCSMIFLPLKETTGAFYAPCVAAVIWCKLRGPNFSWTRAMRLCAAATAVPVAVFVIIAVMCGGADAVIAVLRHDAEGLPGNYYAMTSQNGAWFTIPLSYLLMGPVPAVLCLVGICGAAWRCWRNWKMRSLNALREGSGGGAKFAGVLSILVVVMVTGDTFATAMMNLRYLTLILGACCLLSGYGLMIAVKACGRLIPGHAKAVIPAVATFIVIAACWMDYARYREVYVRQGLADLSVQQVMATSSIPWVKDITSGSSTRQ